MPVRPAVPDSLFSDSDDPSALLKRLKLATYPVRAAAGERLPGTYEVSVEDTSSYFYEVSVEDTSSYFQQVYQPEVIALFSVIGICGIALLGLLVFTVVKMISSLF